MNRLQQLLTASPFRYRQTYAKPPQTLKLVASSIRATAPLHAAIATLQEQAEKAERQQTQNKIVIRGWQVEPDLQRSQLVARANLLLDEHLPGNRHADIVTAPFIGRQSDSTRPIRLALQTLEDKHAVFSASKSLRAERIYLMMT